MTIEQVSGGLRLVCITLALVLVGLGVMRVYNWWARRSPVKALLVLVAVGGTIVFLIGAHVI